MSQKLFSFLLFHYFYEVFHDYKCLMDDKSTADCPVRTRCLLPRHIVVDPVFPVAALSSKIEKERCINSKHHVRPLDIFYWACYGQEKRQVKPLKNNSDVFSFLSTQAKLNQNIYLLQELCERFLRLCSSEAFWGSAQDLTLMVFSLPKIYGVYCVRPVPDNTDLFYVEKSHLLL